MFRPIVFNEKACTGCNRCVDICLMDIMEKNPEKGKPPKVVYPDQCAYDGACWLQCPCRDKGAITIVPPLPMRVAIVRGKGRAKS